MNANPVRASEARRGITTEAAATAVSAAVAHAGALGVRVNAAVTDGAGTLMAFLRMPGAFLHSVEIAIDKAYTAASFGLPTSQWPQILAGDDALRLGRTGRSLRAGRLAGDRPGVNGASFLFQTLRGTP